MGSLTGRTRIARLYRVAIPPGAGGLSRLESMAVNRRKSRLAIMVRISRLTRLNNTTWKNRLRRTIRRTN